MSIRHFSSFIGTWNQHGNCLTEEMWIRIWQIFLSKCHHINCFYNDQNKYSSHINTIFSISLDWSRLMKQNTVDCRHYFELIRKLWNDSHNKSFNWNGNIWIDLWKNSLRSHIINIIYSSCINHKFFLSSRMNFIVDFAFKLLSAFDITAKWIQSIGHSKNPKHRKEQINL